mgnify:FL=1
MNILEKYNQEQLERFYKDLNKTEQNKLQKEIENIDFEQINSLYINSKKDEIIELKEIKPIKYYIKKKLSKSIIEEYSNLAKEILRKNKLCVITMAGGQGSRLGVNGPKGMFKLNIDGKLKSFFEINCEKLIKANKQYNIEILWLIMTSKENDLQTQEFFRNNNYFGYPKNRIIFFTQNEIPVLDLNGKILLEEKYKIKKAANGNGDVFEALSKNNIINKLDDEGIEYISFMGIDNILANPIDYIFLGMMAYKKYQVASKSIFKENAMEKSAVFCKRRNRPYILGYDKISKELSEEKAKNGEFLYRDCNVLAHLMTLKAVKKVIQKDLPYHRVFRKTNALNQKGESVIQDSFKFEKFIFDAFSYFEDMLVLRIEKDEFAPIKNKEDIEFAIKEYNKK